MNYFIYFRNNLVFILILGILCGLGGLGFSIAQTKKYESREKLLVIQKGRGTMDPYTASKSAENISSILKEVIYTNSFFKQVMKTNYYLTNDFGESEEEQMKHWEEAVKIETVKDTGILNIQVYHKDRTQAEQLSHAIANVLLTNGQQYHGGGENISIRIIDGPRVSEKTVVPNTLQNTLLGILLGISFGIVYLIIRYETGNIKTVRIPKIDFSAVIKSKRKNTPKPQQKDRSDTDTPLKNVSFNTSSVLSVKDEVTNQQERQHIASQIVKNLG